MAGHVMLKILNISEYLTFDFIKYLILLNMAVQRRDRSFCD